MSLESWENRRIDPPEESYDFEVDEFEEDLDEMRFTDIDFDEGDYYEQKDNSFIGSISEAINSGYQDGATLNKELCNGK